MERTLTSEQQEELEETMENAMPERILTSEQYEELEEKLKKSNTENISITRRTQRETGQNNTESLSFVQETEQSNAETLYKNICRSYHLSVVS